MGPYQKIDLVSENASPLLAGGQSEYVSGLAAALAAAGHDVTVWTRRDRPDLPDRAVSEAGVAVRHVDAGPARALPVRELLPHLPAFATALRAAWSADPPHVAHAHHWTSGLVTLAAVRELAVPVVATFHGLGTTPDPATPGRARVERHLAQAVDRVVATAADEVDALLAMGVPRPRIARVAPGVDTATITPNGPAHPRGDQPRLVARGGLARGGGVDEAIVALARVPRAELVVAGGSAGDPDLARLRTLAAAGGVRDRVRFIGSVPPPELPALLRSADVVLSVPWHEPFGATTLTAMACGRPVVASAVGVSADAVVDGVTGILVPPHRLREPAAAVRQILSSSTMALAMGTAGRDRAETRYGWDRAARAAVEVYTEMCDEPELTG